MVSNPKILKPQYIYASKQLKPGSWFPSENQIRSGSRFPPEKQISPPEFDDFWNLIKELFLKSSSSFYIENLAETKEALILDSYIITHPWTVTQNKLGFHLGNNLFDQLNIKQNWSLIIPSINQNQYFLIIVERRNDNINSYILDPELNINYGSIINDVNYTFNSQTLKVSIKSKNEPVNKYFIITMIYNYIKEKVDLKRFIIQ